MLEFIKLLLADYLLQHVSVQFREDIYDFSLLDIKCGYLFSMQVLLADSEKFKYGLAEPWAKLVYLVQKKGSYSHIICGSSSFGKNVLPRAAALLDVSPITDVTEINGSNLFVR